MKCWKHMMGGKGWKWRAASCLHLALVDLAMPEVDGWTVIQGAEKRTLLPGRLRLLWSPCVHWWKTG